MYDFVVVGSGLFGSIISRALTASGATVAVVDDGRPLSGSVPAACLMKPGWASAMSYKEYEQAIQLLESLYGPVREIKLRARPMAKQIPVTWLDPKVILSKAAAIPEHYADRAIAVSDKKVDLEKSGCILHAKIAVIVCTGCWAEELVPELRGTIVPKGGWAFTWSGQIADPFLQVWAPYRQLIAFNRGPNEIWCGDGTALIKKSFESCGTMHKSLQRCVEALGQDADPANGPKILAGYRPYFKGPKTPALIHKANPGLYVATGGGKNGTLGAAWAARQLVDRLA